jgi:hypothetical protein
MPTLSPRPTRALVACLLLSVLFALLTLLACEATPGRALSGAVEPAPEAAAARWSPPPENGGIARVFRATLTLTTPLSADGLRAGRTFVVIGGVDAADLAALAKGRTSGAMAKRLVPHLVWGAPIDAPVEIGMQPLAPLDPGPFALVVLRDKGAPIVEQAIVGLDDTPIATRVYPPTGSRVAPGTPWIYCLGPATPWDPQAPLGAGTLAPDDRTLRARRLEDEPCVTIEPERGAIGPHAPPPSLEGFGLLDPGGVEVALDAPDDDEEECAAGEIALGPACLRLDDDRAILAAGTSASFVHGTIGDVHVATSLPPRARVLVRGLRPFESIDVALTVHAQRTRAIEERATTLAAHAHLVVNEALAHPPSGAATQRFVELVNDGAAPLQLAGLVLADGDAEFELPDGIVPPGGFVLILPEGFVDGLGGDEAPSQGALRLYVDALKLTGEIAVLDEGGTVRSRLPASTSTKTASRGRRTPDRPDDAADAFGWDANGRATPGRANQIGP